MKPKSFRASILAAPLIALSATTASAVNDGIWTDTSASGNWNDSTKWSGNLPAYGATFTAYFASNITADATVTQDVSPLLIGNLLFSDNGATGSKWTLAGQSVTLGDGGSPSLSTITTLTPTTISAQLIGANAITKAGASSLTLSGANTYSGGNNLQEGTLTVSNATALGSGPVSATGSPTLTYTTAFANNISIDGTNLNLSGNFNNLSGVISGTGNLTATGTVQLTGANTYSGRTIITGGFFCFKADSAFGAIPGVATSDSIALSGGGSPSTYISGAAFTLNANRGIVLSAGYTGDWDINSTLNVAGVISGPGRLSKTLNNAGTLVLSGANTYSGGTIVAKGIISLGTGGTGADTSVPTALGTGAVTINAGGTVRLWIQNTKSYTIANNWVLNGGTLLGEDGIYTLPGTISLGTNGGSISSKWDGKSTTAAGVISGTGPLSIVQSGGGGTGDVILTGANTYTGATSILGTRLSISSLNSVTGGTATSNLGAPMTVANGTLAMGSPTTTGTLVYTGTGETTDRVINLNGGAAITQSGTGLLKFSSSLTATGIGSRIVTLSGSTAGTGEIAGAIIDNGITGSTPLVATFAAGATTVTLGSVDGIVVGATITGTGITGGQTITAINTATKVVTLSAGANAASGPVGSSYVVPGVKNITHLSKAGSGTWTVSGTNTYTGTTTVNGGVLKFPKQASLYNNTPASWTTANLTVASGATAAFNIGGAGEFTVSDINTLQGLTNVVVGTPSATGFKSGSFIGLDTTNAPGGAITYGTVISDHVAGTSPTITTDTLGLRKLGPGTLTLSAINAYTAGTIIDAGTINLTTGGGSGAIRGNVTINAGATLKVSVADALGYNQNFRTGNLTLNSGTIDIQHTGNNSPTSVGITLAGGTITGMAGSKMDLRNNGAGDTSVTTNASATTSTISLTTLGMAGQTNTTFTIAAGTTASGIDLLVSANLVNTAGAGVAVTPSYNVVKAGAGHMRLAGANTYTGTTTINAGTLSGTGSATSALTVNAAGTLAPGSGIGTWAAKSATFVTGATFKAEINSTAVTADKLAAAGAVDLGGATLNLTDLGTGTLAGGTKLTLVDYTGGSLTGTFAGLAEGSTVTLGANNFTLSYVDSSKVTLSVAGSGYSSWAAANAGGQTANLDFDGDGIRNGVEYFMGLTGSSFTANPQPVNGVITWPKDPLATASYVVEVSENLVTWDPASNGSVTDSGTSVSYTLPTGSAKRFVRLKVTTP
ncbi:autotransporter-associated beta strand repeat-containing protein [Luteolibacter ambystomatis]|uniref:Autotransporter-associated beta strand repeat-containing protein n=1 Tax=Luteolibacter ambystomatis TaxID=2824561 RepID=A0A975G5V7_9BACT|nr:autotransporter-associated beta strand repeat-containing protein [Luteolibacter ambystomatis]QUE49372.1 autotransporter-associated beta strand repeat-containing protein [Luteolibacter ambystomatis]